MAEKTFHCRLITPAECVLSEDVRYASIPAWDGLFGVQRDRAPLVAKLGLGELRLDFPSTGSSKGGSRSLLIEDGFVQVVDNRVTILASIAIPTETLTETDAQAELAEAQARRVPEGVPNRVEAQAQVDRDKRRAELKLTLARKQHGKGI